MKLLALITIKLETLDNATTIGVKSVKRGEHKLLHDKFSFNLMYKSKRDREPSRVSLKFCKTILKNKKFRLMCIKKIIKNCPKTSSLVKVVQNIHVLRRKLAKQERPFPDKNILFSPKSKTKLHAKCSEHTCSFIQKKVTFIR